MYIFTHTHIYIYIYIYRLMFICITDWNLGSLFPLTSKQDARVHIPMMQLNNTVLRGKMATARLRGLKYWPRNRNRQWWSLHLRIRFQFRNVVANTMLSTGDSNVQGRRKHTLQGSFRNGRMPPMAIRSFLYQRFAKQYSVSFLVIFGLLFCNLIFGLGKLSDFIGLRPVSIRFEFLKCFLVDPSFQSMHIESFYKEF